MANINDNKPLISNRIDYELFSNNLCNECRRFKTYFYGCPHHQSQFQTHEERMRTHPKAPNFPITMGAPSDG